MGDMKHDVVKSNLDPTLKYSEQMIGSSSALYEMTVKALERHWSNVNE